MRIFLSTDEVRFRIFMKYLLSILIHLSSLEYLKPCFWSSKENEDGLSDPSDWMKLFLWLFTRGSDCWPDSFFTSGHIDVFCIFQIRPHGNWVAAMDAANTTASVAKESATSTLA
jgi:hypothetical protein